MQSFDNIRPYFDSEIQNVFVRFLSDPELMRGAEVIIPSAVVNDFKQNYRQITDIDTFQVKYMMPMLKNLMKIKHTKITFSGIENIKSPAIFISNHRDIVIDPSFLQYVLVKNGFKTSEVAIGNNLAADTRILACMRLNKSFVVMRNLNKGEQIRAFIELSDYIKHTIAEKKHSIWLAQREGRAKDSNDKTQASLLKMLALSGDDNFINNIKALNLSPLSISYEYDACDYLKAKELQQKRDNENFIKSTADDVVSMQTGVLGYASEIHYAFTPCINEKLDKIAEMRLPRNQEVDKVAELIDNQIYSNYKIYKNNYIACDLLTNGTTFEKNYTKEDLKNFDSYLSKQIAKIDLANTDIRFCREKILEMYSNPLKNKLLTEK